MRTKASGRGKGSGTLEKHGRVWRARWVVNGKTFTRSTGTSDKRQAESMLAKWTEPFRAESERDVLINLETRIRSKGEVIDEMNRKQPGYSPVKAWDVFNRKAQGRKCDPGTLKNYEQWWWLFVEWMKFNHPEVVELRSVTLKIAEEYARELLSGTPEEKRKAVKKVRKPVRGTTYNRHMNALALVWKTVAKDLDSKLGENPFSWDPKTDTGIPRIVLRKGEKPHRRRDMTFKEVHDVLNAAKGEWRCVLAVGYYVGIRLKDCVLLQWGDVDLVAQMIVTRSHKTDVETKTRIHPALWRILQENVKTTSGYLFPALASLYNSGDAGRAELSKSMSEIFESVGIRTSYRQEGSVLRAVPDCTFHSLRHSYNSHLKRLGFDRGVRQSLMGHKTQAMTSHYEHGYADAPLMLPDLMAYGGDPSEDKLAQLKALVDTMTDEERKEAKALCDRYGKSAQDEC